MPLHKFLWLSVKWLGYGLDDWGSITSRAGFFFSTPCPAWLWSPHSLLCCGYWCSFFGGKATGGVKLKTHLYIVPRLRMRGATPPLSHMSARRGTYLSTRDSVTSPMSDIAQCLRFIYIYISSGDRMSFPWHILIIFWRLSTWLHTRKRGKIISWVCVE
jgi:hypothetical protein